MKLCVVEHVLQKAQAPYICGYCKQLVKNNNEELNIHEIEKQMQPVANRVTKTGPLLLRKNHIIV